MKPWMEWQIADWKMFSGIEQSTKARTCHKLETNSFLFLDCYLILLIS